MPDLKSIHVDARGLVDFVDQVQTAKPGADTTVEIIIKETILDGSRVVIGELKVDAGPRDGSTTTVYVIGKGRAAAVRTW